MTFRLAKLRVRRIFRRHKARLSKVGNHTNDHLERNFFKRLHHLASAKKFVLFWSVPIILLIGLTAWQSFQLGNYYLHSAPTSGGIYREGIIGQYTNANPIFATSPVDKTISKLVFAGLFSYDQSNQLVGALADDLSISKDGKSYVVKLKSNLKWQDGQPVTAADVAFTFRTVQNPVVGSPLASSWQNVGIEVKSPLSVQFNLPNPLASFKYGLTTGIIPQHILSKLSPSKLRSADFNTLRPIGAGPFILDNVSSNASRDPNQTMISLEPFAGYFAGEPKLGGMIIHSYTDQTAALKALQNRDIGGLAGLDDLPANLALGDLQFHSLPLAAETMVFFREGNALLKNGDLRQALSLATDRMALVNGFRYKVQPIFGPLLSSQLGYNSKYDQPAYNLSKARSILNKAGWKLGENGILQKSGKPLEFSLSYFENGENDFVAKSIKNQWQALGVNLKLLPQTSDVFQLTASSHSYDALLDTIAVGTDPDVYIYWDSAQATAGSATGGLNFSEFKDATADEALSAGRTRLDNKLRAVKYSKFLERWQNNVPAVALYQPSFIYLTNRPIFNFGDNFEINNPVGRFANVANWEIRQAKVSY